MPLPAQKQDFKRSKTAKISNRKGRKDKNVTKANHLIDDKTWEDILNHLYEKKNILVEFFQNIGQYQIENSPNIL